MLEWLESMRKDVQCTFGILKGRWRILKSGIRVHGVSTTDKIWLTCCVLHNLLLQVDGLTEKWRGKLGLHNIDEELDNVPFAIQHLSNGSYDRNYDASEMGPEFVENDSDDEAEEPHPQITDMGFGDDLVSQHHVNKLNNLSFTIFRQKLITHFDYLFKKNKIKWPERRNH